MFAHVESGARLLDLDEADTETAVVIYGVNRQKLLRFLQQVGSASRRDIVFGQ